MSVKGPVLVRAEGLGFAYPGHTVLEGVRFSLPPGLTLLRGGDGRGKTTLLRLIAGALSPTTGTILREAGPVFLENVADPALDQVVARTWLEQCAGRYPGWQETLIEGLVDRFFLREHLDKRLHMLSTGSRRKVGLVAAAACGAPVILLDMPCAGLDLPSRKALSDGLADAARSASSAWVLADYEVPDGFESLPWGTVIDLGD